MRYRSSSRRVETDEPRRREATSLYEYVDMSRDRREPRRGAIEQACEQAQESLNIQQGPMIRVVQMGLGEGRRGRLLIVIHHLVVDEE